jgi:preprotein translocase subunit SecE
MASGASSAVERVKGWPERFRRFYDGIRREMRLVTWPTRAQVQSTTIVVIVTVFVFGFFFFIVDTVLSRSLNELYRYFVS